MSDEKIEQVVICGSGPAGYTAALYTARANMNPYLIEGVQPGGQLTITTDVENFPGFVDGIMGPELMDVMRRQVERFGTRFSMEEIVEADLSTRPFSLKLSNGDHIRTRSLIIATGASARYLGLENEIRLQGYGVSACATCDGFFYRNQVVGVVGGGDSACEEATFLTKFASEVHMFVRRNEFRASKIMAERALNNPKITVHWHTEVIDVLGSDGVTGVRLLNNLTQEQTDLNLHGLFLAIGHTPNSGPFKQWLETDENGYIITQSDTSYTNVPGVFACGDVQDHVYRQAVTAAGSGCMAALDAERWLENQEAH
ncbi:MAG: thioredoxin-disulfide reductase [Myxococcota bacterium]